MNGLRKKKKYSVIYADPPWRYEHPISNSRRIENKYPTMATKDIAALKVPAADDCVLFLWATSPKLEEAFVVMRAWGFSYRSSMVWNKCSLGMGYWFRVGHEILLVGVKGKVRPPSPSLRRSSLLHRPKGLHSRKPSEVRDMIRRWYPAGGGRVELFARERTPGWNVWGNEVDSDFEI